LSQVASGTIHVEHDDVRLEMMLPWALASLADKIRPVISGQGSSMLEKK
jgi:hypothetical protein